MIEWSETDLMIRDALREFIAKEIRPHTDALESGELPPYDIIRKLFAAFGIDVMAAQAVKSLLGKKSSGSGQKLGGQEGMALIDAALEGAKLRLRPILMTSFAFMLGCVPLATASGAGALSRQIMGFVIIGGMIFASFIAIFLIPVLYYMVERLKGKKKPSHDAPETPPPHAHA